MQKYPVYISLSVLIIGITAYFLAPVVGKQFTLTGSPSASATVPPVTAGKRFVFSVSLHSAEEINKLLTRAEELSRKIPTNTKHPGIALVLHGPELAFFSKKNYKKYKAIVDRARRLDKNKVIDIKVCRTMMRSLMIKKTDMPDFVEIVPYGPDEVSRLIRQGFIKL